MTHLRIPLVGLTIALSSLAWSTAALAVDLSPQEIYERAAPSVVLLISTSDEGKGSGGTGSIIREDGLVLTNAHVVLEDKTGKPYPRISVYMKPARVTGDRKNDLSRGYKAGLVAADKALDLALVKIEGELKSPPVLKFADPEEVRIGARVAAIGHPEQGGLWTLTTGVVSAEFENFGNVKGKHVFQTETGLNRGNSGGPLLDTNGQQVGVNTAIARLAADGLPITSISFSIKSSVARQWLRDHGVSVDYAARVAEPPRKPEPPVKKEGPAVPAPVAGAGQPTPPQKSAPAPTPAPQVHTEPHPYNLDSLIGDIQRVQSELEGEAEKMREQIRRRR